MRIRKYDVDFGRRELLQKVGYGISAAGVLAPLWPLIARGADVSRAYPDELLSIELYTKGRIKPGDVIDANNVEYVKELIDPVCYRQITEVGRKLHVVAPTLDATRLFPHDYLEATLRNRGRARFNDDRNVVTDKGESWIGGLPFAEPKDGLEAVYNLALNWGRHDYSQYAIRDWDIKPDGSIGYQYDFVWVEMNATARTDGKAFAGRNDILRYQSIFFTRPNDASGTSFLNTWYYDQRKFPDLQGYLPAFKRVRQFPTNQRFEPLVPGLSMFLSDAWATGDPTLTWGNHKIVERRPFLGAIGGANYYGNRHPNWEYPTHGGPKGLTFFETHVEMCPEVLVIEAEPVGYPRSPYSKRRIYIDARNCMFLTSLQFDRRGEVWKQFEAAFGPFDNGRDVVKEPNGHTLWSWNKVMSYDIQTHRVTRFSQVKQIEGGYRNVYSGPGTDEQALFNKFLTIQAMQRLGSA